MSNGIPIFYLRSSTYSGYEWCEQKYYINSLGIPDIGNKKAEKGNIVHKALELLANKQLCIQTNKTEFEDKELELKFTIDSITPESSIEHGYYYYSKKSTHSYVDEDFQDCKNWLNNTLNFRNGLYSPLKRNIIYPEHFFDFEIEEDWANYTYNINGKDIVGRLRVRGTVDLITEVTDDTLEYVDWKSGERKNWNKGCKKEYKDFKDDFQLRLYHLAISRLFPNYQYIIITIFWIRDGGPFTIYFDKDDIPETKNKIRKRFEQIKQNRYPRLTKDKWKCKICEYHKPADYTDGKSVCEFFKKEINQKGIDKVNDQYLNLASINKYEGGGKTIDV